jgi:hypothetical protein
MSPAAIINKANSVSVPARQRRRQLFTIVADSSFSRECSFLWRRRSRAPKVTPRGNFCAMIALVMSKLYQGLGEAFTPEVEAAWTAAYMTLATAMQPAPIAQPMLA